MKIIFNYFVFTVLLFQYNSVLCQNATWYVVRGNISTDDSWGIDVDTNGDIYWTTVHKNPPPYGFYDIYLYKFSDSGNQIWISSPFGAQFNDVCFPVKVSGNYVYTAGRTDLNIWQTDTDPLVLCYDKVSGNIVWGNVYAPSPNYGYEEIDGLSIQPDGIYFTAWSRGQGANDMNILIQKLSLTGQLIWSNTYDFNGLNKHDGANGHLVIDDNYIYVAAHVNKASLLSNDGDAALICFSRADGSYQWHSIWGGNSWDHGLGLTMSSDSILYMVGHTGSYGSVQQFFINKYQRDGQLLWSRLWGGPGAELARAVVCDGDSIIYAAGTTTSYGNGDNEIFVLKYNSNGVLLDSLFWGGHKKEQTRDMAINNGYLYITGYTESFHYTQGDTASDALLLKINGRTMQAPDTIAIANIVMLDNKEQKLFIYPNPISDIIYIENISTNKKKKYQIFNSIGQLAKEGFVYSNQIGTTDLTNGFYFIRVTTDKEYYFGKFVKE